MPDTVKEFYSLSDNISIFPAANRSFKYDSQSRLMSEVNLTNIVKSLGPNHSFVISKSIEDSPFKFILGGYYIELSDIKSIIDDVANELPEDESSTTLYASIKVKKSNSENISILQGNDTSNSETAVFVDGVAVNSDSTYTGVIFSYKPIDFNDDYIGYSIKIVDNFNSKPEVPESSLSRLDYFDYSFDIFDCGNWNDPIDESEISKIYEQFGISDWKLA